MTLRTDRRSLPRTADTTSSGAPRKQYYTTKKQKNPTVGVAFRLETQLYNEVMACAKDLGLNFSAFVRCAIESYLDNYRYDNDLATPEPTTLSDTPVCPVVVASGVEVPGITALTVPESRVYGIAGEVTASFPQQPPAQSSGQAVSSLPQDLLEAFGVPVACVSETGDTVVNETLLTGFEDDGLEGLESRDCFGENYVTALAEALLDFDSDTDSDSEADSESFSESDYVEPGWEDEFPDLDDLEDFE